MYKLNTQAKLSYGVRSQNSVFAGLDWEGVRRNFWSDGNFLCFNLSGGYMDIDAQTLCA